MKTYSIWYISWVLTFVGLTNSCDLARIPSLTPPTAAFSVDKTNCEAPCTITITNNSSNASGYRWDFGSGQGSDAQNPNKITYTTPGMYSIQLITIGEEGLKDTVVVVISIAEKGNPPVARFSVSNNNCTAPCDPGFVNESLNGSSYRWEFGSPDSTSTAMSPQYTFKKGGEYPVKLSVSNAFGSDDTTVMVKIMDRPTIKACFTYTAGTLVAPATVAFDATCSSPNATYTWDFGDANSVNNTAAGLKPQHIFSKAGKYKVKLNVLANNVAAESIQEIEVLEPVLTNFSYTASNDGFVPTTFTFTNKSSDNASNFLWNFGDPASGSNNTSALKNPTHAYSTPGDYIITLTAMGANQISSTKKDTLKLKYRTFALQLGEGVGYSVFQTLDGGYFISSSVGWIKTDQTGKELWRYNPTTNGYSDFKAVQAENGDYYLAYESGESNKEKIRVVRLSSNGNILKQLDFNTTETSRDYLGDILINRNKELILYGDFYRSTATTILKLEAKHYKLDNALSNNPTLLITISNVIPGGIEMIQATDGSYIGVRSQSIFSLGSSTTSYKWLQSISGVGTAADVVQSSSGSLFVAGRNKTNTAHLSKHTLGTGVLENAKDFGYASSYFREIVNSKDNQLVACGSGEVFLTKINATDFKEIWRKPNTAFPNSDANGLANTSDGGYIIVGSIKVGPNNNIYLIKIDSNGNL